MKVSYLFFAFILLSSALTYGFINRDDDPLKNLLSRLEKYRNDFPQEKVHLHLDKPFYAIGDNIWFKAYVVDAEGHQLSNLSKILYVDLINEKDSVKKSLCLSLTAGLAWGDFNLTDSLREGNYRIRAYTNWMRNFGEEYFFDKTIRIGNAWSTNILTNASYTFSKTGNSEKAEATINYSDLDGNPLANKEVNYEVQLDFRSIAKGKGITDKEGNLKLSFTNNQPFILKSGRINTSLKLDDKHTIFKTLPVKSTSNEVDVQFFPEGGQLVDSIRSKVAFKAVSSDGLGANVSGYIADKDNNRLFDIRSDHAGMGVFALLPTAGNSYTAVIKFADGSEKRIALPKAQRQGYILSVTNTDTASLYIKISASKSLLQEGEVTLVAQANQVVQYVSKSKFETNTLSATLPKKRFPTGILQLTLFSPAYQPVAERVVFIQHNDQLQLDFSSDKASYGKRQKVKMTVDASDAAGKPVRGSFSVAVTDMSKVPADEDAETTIFSNLLLSSDLKGYIEKPNYYFTTGNSADKMRQLDNLMLTQGWRRFEWRSIQADVFPQVVFKPEQSITISGRVTTSGGAPVAGGKVTLLATGGDGMLLDTVTNAQGRFVFENLVFRDSTRFVVQARNTKDRKNVEIELDRVPPQLVTRNKNAADVQVNVNRSLLPYLQNSRKQYEDLQKRGLNDRTIMLGEVKVTEKKAEVKNSSNLNGAGNADAIIKAEQLQNCADLAQCLQGRVAGLIIQNGRAYLLRNMASSFSGPIPMQLVVDGMYLDPDYLTSINVNDVETIEVLKNIGNTAIYGLRGGGGVLVITTKRGERSMSYTQYAPGITSYAPKGYYIARKFYSPNYDDPKTSTQAADLRTTIYWNPNIITGADGKISFDFFTADSPGTYRAVVEGIDDAGKLGRKVYQYTIK